jgi:hypothetical protein
MNSWKRSEMENEEMKQIEVERDGGWNIVSVRKIVVEGISGLYMVGGGYFACRD